MARTSSHPDYRAYPEDPPKHDASLRSCEWHVAEAAIRLERQEYELTPEAIELGLGDALPALFEIGQERLVGAMGLAPT